MDPAALGSVYQFEGFVLDLVRGALLDANGVEVSLRAKSFELLRLFVNNAGRLLDRETINRAIWADVVVTDDAITQCVRDVRRALGDNDQSIIRTVPRRGYLLTVEVATAQAQSLCPPATDSARPPDKPSVAVLPFDNLSGDPEQEYFSDGLADDIITELSRCRSLFVIARNSSFAYRGRAVGVKQIALDLGVRYVVEGSVRRAARRIRVNAQLIDAEAGNHLWAERYDRDLEDVFAVQDEITMAVVTAIQPAVADAELRRALRKTPGNLGAWEAYQRGLWYLGRFTVATDNEQARECFQASITLDPEFAPAYAGLSLTHIREVLWSPRYSGSLTSAETWARKAVEIDASDSEAQAMLAHTASLAGNREEGRQRALLALEMNPSSAWGNYAKGESLLFDGCPAEAREPLTMALRVDPRGPLTSHFMMLLMVSYYFERDYANAIEAGLRMVSRYPDLPQPYRYLAASYGQLGRSGEARKALEKATASTDSFQGYVRDRPIWYRFEDYEHMLDGLRKAGWQD
jgi:TolB-like protein